MASLLLSESYLAAETAEPTAAVAAATTKRFLETREALCLSADVSAHVYPQTDGQASRGSATLMPSRAGNSSAQKQLSRASRESSEHLEAKVSVDSVLRELKETDQKRKRRLLRRQQRHRRRRRRGEQARPSSRREQPRHSGTDTDGIEADTGLPDEGHPWEEVDNDDKAERRGRSVDGGRSPPPERSKPSTGSSFENRSERGSSKTTVTGPRLALAASVSTMSGLLERSSTQRGRYENVAFPSIWWLASP